jgi:hypothetical protein
MIRIGQVWSLLGGSSKRGVTGGAPFNVEKRSGNENEIDQTRKKPFKERLSGLFGARFFALHRIAYRDVFWAGTVAAEVSDKKTGRGSKPLCPLLYRVLGMP